MKKIFYIILILLLLPGTCLAGSKAKKEVKEGNLLYNKGEFGEALKRYQEAILDSPDSDIVNFDLGTALYKTGNYQAAVGHFEKSLLTGEQSLGQKASYNTGNAKYKYGIGKEDADLPSAINLLKESLHHYQSALEIAPEDEDAEYNYQFVKKELERLQKKLEQQQKEQKQQHEGEKQQQKEQKQQQEGEKQQQEGQKQQQEGQKEQQKEQTEKEQEEETLKTQPEKDQQQKEEVGEGEPLEPAAEMSEEEAAMLLENYRQEEEPKGLYREKISTRGMPEVLKDW